MKNYYKLLKIILLLALAAGCSEEIYETHNKVNLTDNEIQFKQFKTETGLIKFKFNLDISNQNQALNKTLSMVDFVIDTVAIKKHISIDKKNTYSFRIYPINSRSEHGKFYNIVYRKENNKWETSIVSFKKNEGSSNKQNKYKDVANIYDSTMRGGCTMEIITIQCNGSCTRNDKNAECDGFACETGECLQHTFSTVPCIESGTSGGAYVGTVQTSPGSTTNPAGGGGVEPQIYLQNPYVFIPNDSENPYFVGRNYINQVKAQEFWASLGIPNQTWAVNNSIAYLSIIQHQISKNWSAESNDFALQLIDLAREEPNQQDASNILNITLMIETAGTQLFDDNFALSLDPYIDLDLQSLSTPPYTGIAPNTIVLKTYLKYRLLRQMNPTWSRAQCSWEATKDIIHISLDAFGLIPVGGEIADLLNGVLYTIEGDGINATLSYASAVPIVGWAPAGTKFGLLLVTTNTGTTKLVWRVVGNLLQFGNRGQLRKILNLGVGNPLVAHHIIPWAKSGHAVIQRAARSINAFHLNKAINGIPLSTAIHNGSHSHYDDIIVEKMDDFIQQFPNATPDDCLNYLLDIIGDARSAILNNPTTPINQLIF